MKKNLMSISALSLMILAVATSCSKNEVNPTSPNFGIDPNQISFRASTGQTKANDNFIGNLQAEGGFHVIGITKADAYMTGFVAPSANNEVLYSFNKGWDWANAAEKPKKQWPAKESEDYPVMFFAAFPTTVAVTNAKPTDDFTQTSNVTVGMDPFNTYYQGIKNVFTPDRLTIDYLAANTSVAAAPTTGMANLAFKHIMSNMKFQILTPNGYTAKVQSVKIANIGLSGGYNYKTSVSSEVAYGVNGQGNHGHFVHFDGVAQRLVAKDATSPLVIEGLPDGLTSAGFNTLKLVPQKLAPVWNVGVKGAPAANSFRSDAAKWAAARLDGGATGTTTALDITRWHNAAPAANGMMGSEGWKGARVELIYSLVDDKGVAVTGRIKGFEQASDDRYVRVGFPLDLAAIKTMVTGADGVAVEQEGFLAGKRFAFTIPLGTENATGGILLDPDYKDENGGSTEEGVDNPKVVPGDPIVDPERPIQFKVSVSEWDEVGGVLGETTFTTK